MRSPLPWMALCGALAAAGCQAKVLSPTPGDQLRRRNAELEAQVESLGRELSEARSALATSERERRSPQEPAAPDARLALSEEAVQATPHLARMGIASSSHTDRPPKGEGCVARIYLEPVDGLGRFLQVVGSATVTVYWSPPGCNAQVLSCQSFGPMALRGSYRSGFGGAHYSLECPIDLAQLPPESGAPAGESSGASQDASRWSCGDPVEVKVEFEDALSGRVFTAQRALPGIAPRKVPGG